ncbi:hypothetical protein JKP88DRAFT_265153 [Tribonema minus]|uniref:B30.2/SPRY domain-containing protein n=1 Tax=Tribonema minus TaxID=303371 RepID=A0A835YU33_9STRA|nr:hypothetical protein JKP88DRAFT_265153 [Tribonema minus]
MQLAARYRGRANHAHDVGCVCADEPLPEHADTYYFEVTVLLAAEEAAVTAAAVLGGRRGGEEADMELDEDRNENGGSAHPPCAPPVDPPHVVERKRRQRSPPAPPRPPPVDPPHERKRRQRSPPARPPVDPPHVVVGLVHAQSPLSQSPGSTLDDGSCGYGGADGGVMLEGAAVARGRDSWARFGEGDTVGCGVDFKAQEVFFTLNGEYLHALRHPRLCKPLYPAAGLHSEDARVIFNFGASPFRYDLEHRRRAAAEAEAAAIAGIQIRPEAVEQLVLDYLSSQGYASAHAALVASLKSEATAPLRTALASAPTNGAAAAAGGKQLLSCACGPAANGDAGEGGKGRGLRAAALAAADAMEEDTGGIADEVEDVDSEDDNSDDDDDDDDDHGGDGGGGGGDTYFDADMDTASLEYDSDGMLLPVSPRLRHRHRGPHHGRAAAAAAPAPPPPATPYMRLLSTVDSGGGGGGGGGALAASLGARGAAVAAVMAGDVAAAQALVPRGALRRRRGVELALARQRFVELVRAREIGPALEYARRALAPFYLHNAGAPPSASAAAAGSLSADGKHEHLPPPPHSSIARVSSGGGGGGADAAGRLSRRPRLAGPPSPITGRGSIGGGSGSGGRSGVVEAMGLLAFKDPFASPLAYLLDTRRRGLLADSVNEAMAEYASAGGAAGSGGGCSGDGMRVDGGAAEADAAAAAAAAPAMTLGARAPSGLERLAQHLAEAQRLLYELRGERGRPFSFADDGGGDDAR